MMTISSAFCRSSLFRIWIFACVRLIFFLRALDCLYVLLLGMVLSPSVAGVLKPVDCLLKSSSSGVWGADARSPEEEGRWRFGVRASADHILSTLRAQTDAGRRRFPSTRFPVNAAIESTIETFSHLNSRLSCRTQPREN